MIVQHRPGPWIATDQGEGPRGKSLGICISDIRRIPLFFLPRGSAQNLANAQLVAAAPELLAALRKAEVFVKAEWDNRETSFLPEPTDAEEGYLTDARLAHEAIVAAIAKAEGRS